LARRDPGVERRRHGLALRVGIVAKDTRRRFVTGVRHNVRVIDCKRNPISMEGEVHSRNEGLIEEIRGSQCNAVKCRHRAFREGEEIPGCRGLALDVEVVSERNRR